MYHDGFAVGDGRFGGWYCVCMAGWVELMIITLAHYDAFVYKH